LVVLKLEMKLNIVASFSLLVNVNVFKSVFSFFFKGASYLKQPSNYFELTGYISTMMYILPSYDCKTGWQLQVGAIAMFFGWMNVTLYLRK